MLVRLSYILFFSVGLTLPVSLSAQIQVASPSSYGMSAEGLGRATDRLQQHIDDGDIAGVTAAVVRDGVFVYFESLGLMDIEQNKSMRKDALFRTYSMTRQITTVAALILYQEGKFEFDDPIQMYLPDFENQSVLVDPQGTNINQTKERVNDITVQHLITHTSGLGSRSSSLYRENRVRDKNFTLDQMVSNAAQIPLFQDPGTEFRYGIHATILGKLIEVWSGRPLREFLEEELLSKLNMNSTMFWAAGDDQDRLASLYRPVNGELNPYQIEDVPYTERPRLIEGGVGLLSSVGDFVNFSQMILDGGVFEERRILAPEVAELVYENAVPQAAMPIGNTGYWAGSGWTWGGFNLVIDADAYNFPVSEGTIWWDGSAGTRYFIDRQQDIIIVIMAQVSPSNGGGFRENFSRLVDASIQERR